MNSGLISKYIKSDKSVGYLSTLTHVFYNSDYELHSYYDSITNCIPITNPTITSVFLENKILFTVSPISPSNIISLECSIKIGTIEQLYTYTFSSNTVLQYNTTVSTYTASIKIMYMGIILFTTVIQNA